MFRARIGLIALSVLQPELALAQRPYTIFRPTPWAEARALNTDRPDKTEGPFMVPAGRIQFEFDLVTYTRDVSGTGSNRTRFETLALAPVNLKVGLLPNVDVQLVLEPFVHTRQRLLASNLTSTASRFGAITGRVKVNVWATTAGRPRSASCHSSRSCLTTPAVATPTAA